MRLLRLVSSLTTILVIATLLGCSSRVGDYSIISTKNTELGKRYARMAPDSAKVAGTDTKSIMIVIPTGIPNFKEAIDRSIETKGRQLLSDAVIYYDYFYIPMVYGEQKTKTEGTSWKKVEDLGPQVNIDILNAKEVYMLKEINGKPEFVQITKTDPALDSIH
jgi:hypothetical protein